MQTESIKNAVRLALGAGMATAMAAPAAVAQGGDEQARELDRVQVTGSRISRADIEGAQPVLEISREDIDRSGLTSIGDILQNLPVAGSALNTTFNNGGNGSTFIDLRNLGSNRNLVLVNGRRWATTLGGSVDLNQIPSTVIERVEILRDGASAVYGSDAISGVINIITRSDFEGAEYSLYYGQWDEGDGETLQADLSIGTTSDRGSVYMNISYTDQQEIWAGDREIAAVPLFGTGITRGSSGTPQGRFMFYDANDGFAFNDLHLVGGSDVVPDFPNDFVPYTPADHAYNFAPENYLLTPNERRSIYVQGDYELSDSVRVTSEVLYNNRKSSQLLAHMPIFFGAFGFAQFADTVISEDNIYNPFGQDLDPNSNLLFLGRRMIESGNRVFSQNVDTLRVGIGLEGDFNVGNRFWQWDANFVYADVRNDEITEGLLNVNNIIEGLGPSFIDGDNPQCGTPANPGPADCVPLNFFGGQGPDGAGSMTQEMVDFMSFTAQDASRNTLRNFTANLVGDIGDLPAGPVGFAAGVEYQEHAGFDLPDAFIAAGLSTGNIRQPTAGEFDVTEGYVEFALPLLADVTGVRSLDVDVAMRHSDYSGDIGDATTGKLGIRYRPVDDVVIRATYSEGFRAPSISELFLGASDSFSDLSDPCNGVEDGVSDPDLVARCAADGVPTDGSFQQPNTQIRQTIGGAVPAGGELDPEEAESWTFGVVYSPSQIENLDITLDWYQIELTDSITTIGAQNILDGCYDGGLGDLCDLVDRSGGAVSDIRNSFTNINGLEVEGVDLSVNYRFPEYSWGQVGLMWDAAYVRRRDSLIVDAESGEELRIENARRNLGDLAIPRWKSNLTGMWSSGPWNASLTLRYVGDWSENCGDGLPPSLAVMGVCSDPVLLDDGSIDPDGNHQHRVGGHTFTDIQGSYRFREVDGQLTFGVRNALDKEPTVSAASFANSFDSTVHDIPGRFFYARWQQSF